MMDLSDEVNEVHECELGDIVIIEHDETPMKRSYLARKNFAGWLEMPVVWECENGHVVKEDDMKVGESHGKLYQRCPICAVTRFKAVGTDRHAHNISVASMGEVDTVSVEEILEESGYEFDDDDSRPTP